MEENNRIIAEFMGWSTHPRHGDKYLINKSKDRVNLPWYSECNWEASLREFNYHSDWNILMPVIEKIEKEFCSTNIHYYSQKQMYSVDFSGFNIKYEESEYGDDKIKILYDSCIKFINFYNKQKEE